MLALLPASGTAVLMVHVIRVVLNGSRLGPVLRPMLLVQELVPLLQKYVLQ